MAGKYLCCLCNTKTDAPKITVRNYAKCRTLLKDCLLRQAEYSEEVIDEVVGRSQRISLCQKHAPDYLILGFELGRVRTKPDVELTFEEKKKYLEQSVLARDVLKEHMKKEKVLTKQKRIEEILAKAEKEALRKRTIFDASSFRVTGAELRALISTMRRFKCSCATPVINYGRTEKTADGAQVEVICENCDAKNEWIAKGKNAPLTEEQITREEEMLKSLDSAGSGTNPAGEQLFVKQEIVDDGETPGTSSGFDLHIAVRPSPNGIGDVRTILPSPSSLSRSPYVSLREAERYLDAAKANKSNDKPRNLKDVLSACLEGQEEIT